MIFFSEVKYEKMAKRFANYIALRDTILNVIDYMD